MNVLPPIHTIGNPTLDWIVLAVGALVALYWLRALRLAREGVRRFVADLVKSVALYFVSDFALLTLFKLDKSRAQGLSMCAAIIALFAWQNRKRSRYVPAATKRAVIARDLRDREYDPQLHHIDHVWPHSRGGSNTRDNLRVIEKKRNLQKGAKRPRIRDMF